MRKLILTSIGIISCMIGFTQTTFEKIDSVSKNKSQIYSDTKMFIAEYWKSSKDVIQKMLFKMMIRKME